MYNDNHKIKWNKIALGKIIVNVRLKFAKAKNINK